MKNEAKTRTYVDKNARVTSEEFSFTVWIH